MLNTRLHDSVGDPKKGPANREEDVRTVQGLLNVQIVEDRRSDGFLAVDGRVGSETVGESANSSVATVSLKANS